MSEKSASRIPVLIASSLKSVKDTRAWGKLGFSLRETNKYQLNFIGFSEIIQVEENGETYFSSTHILSTWGRIVSQFHFLRALLKVRPELLICCTYEFLPLAGLLKRVLKYKIIYDVQENYVANLDLNPTLSEGKIIVLANLIKAFEASAKIDLYLLAEKCYVKEMPKKHPFLVLENKFSGTIKITNQINFSQEKAAYRFLISGTLTPTYGILKAIKWFKILLQKYPKSNLQIIGHCTLFTFQEELELACNSCPQIDLFYSNSPLDYSLILAAYKDKDFNLLPYQDLPQLWDKMPTKLFESAALGLPVLISNNPYWKEFISPFSGGFTVDFDHPNLALEQFVDAITKTYFSHTPDQSIYWSSIQREFTDAVEQL